MKKYSFSGEKKSTKKTIGKSDFFLFLMLTLIAELSQARNIAHIERKYWAGGGGSPITTFETLGEAVNYAEQGHCGSILSLSTPTESYSNCSITLNEHVTSQHAPYYEAYGYIIKYIKTSSWGVEPHQIESALTVQHACPQDFSRHRYSHCWAYGNVIDHDKGGAKNACSYGNPIEPISQRKIQTEKDVLLPNGFDLVRRYSSNASQQLGPFGYGWRHSFDRYIPSQALINKRNNAKFNSVNLYNSSHVADDPFMEDDGFLPSSQVPITYISRDDHSLRKFIKKNGEYFTDSSEDGGLMESPISPALYYDTDKGIIESYSSNGRLVSQHRINGEKINLEYSDESNISPSVPKPDLLTRVTHSNGRSIEFVYNSLSLVSKILTPSGPIEYTYTPNKTIEYVTYADQTKIKYFYDEPPLIADSLATNLLTGVEDEYSKRISYFGYAQGNAKSTEYAGGASKYEITGWSNSGVTVNTPSGAALREDFIVENGRPLLTKHSRPQGAGCAASATDLAYDVRGNVILKDDFNGKRQCFAYDSSRNIETLRIEGLNGGTSGTSCTAALSASNVSTLAPEARKISTEWHPDWKLETRRAEPGRITTWVYNGQPDPFNGGAIASCTSPMYGATSVDPLPDGKPIAVLCKQVVQSTTDVNGSQGFAATLQTQDPALSWPQVTSRTISYTYNQFGQVLTSTDERGQVTTNTYYTATTGNYTKGDLWKVTNALGHVTEYTQYNPHGQVLQVLDPNGVATSYTYDLRQRLTSVTQAGQLTQIDWWPTGLLKKVTQPDGSFLAYTYDDAHRLTDIADNLGNAVHYELDNAGNRKKEQVKDSSGVLTRQIDRNYDALNRLWKTSTGAPM